MLLGWGKYDGLIYQRRPSFDLTSVAWTSELGGWSFLLDVPGSQVGEWHRKPDPVGSSRSEPLFFDLIEDVPQNKGV